MCYSEEVPTDACFQTKPVSYLLVSPLRRLTSTAVRAVVCSRRRSVPRQPPAYAQSSPFMPSRTRNPSSPPDDASPQRHHFDLTQQFRPVLSSICNWLEEEDVQIIGGWPISAGGYTDLWRGSVDSRWVAIKSYRRYLSFDLPRVFLVCVPGPALWFSCC